MQDAATLVRRRVRAIANLFVNRGAIMAERREIRAIRRDHPGLFVDLSSSERPAGRRILVVCLTDDIGQARLAAILVKALQLRGARVSVLLWRMSWRPRMLFKALNIHNVVLYDDFAEPRDGCRAIAASALDSAPTARDLLHFEYGGARVGRHALSTVVRVRHEPRVDLDDPETREALRHTLEYAIAGVPEAHRMLDATQPEEVLLVDRGYAGLGSIFDVALQRGVSVVQFQAAHRDDAMQLKRYRAATREEHPRSLDPETWRRLSESGLTEERVQRLDEELAARAQGKWFMARRLSHATGPRGPDALRQQLELDPDRKVAALFSHVLWDASMFYGRDVYPDQGKWFSETVRLAAEDDRVQWLVKLHPALYWKLRTDGVAEEPAEITMIRETVGTLPPHMRLIQPNDDIDNVDLFQILDAGVTIRGTVGMELPQLGVPVLTAGTSDYTGRGFTVDAETIEEYERNVRSIADLPRLDEQQIRTATLYAYGIFCVRPWRFQSYALDFLPLDEAGDTLKSKLRYVVRTLEELRDAEDLAAFARWVLETDDADYVDESRLSRERVVS